jgi:hypothetical protein
VDDSDYETDINILFNMAFLKLAFMPFAYIMDKFRWDIYTEETSLDNLNCHWVKLSAEIQGEH